MSFLLQPHVSLTTRLGPSGLEEATANDAAVARAFSDEENSRRASLDWKGNTYGNPALLFGCRGVPKQIVRSRLMNMAILTSTNPSSAILKRQEDKDAYRLFVHGQPAMDAFFLLWRTAEEPRMVLVPPCTLGIGMLRLLHVSRPSRTAAQLTDIAHQMMPLPPGVSTIPKALEKRYTRALNESNSGTAKRKYSRLVGDDAKHAYLGESVYAAYSSTGKKKAAAAGTA